MTSAITIHASTASANSTSTKPGEIDFAELERFFLYCKIAYEDPFPYSDSLHLDFLAGPVPPLWHRSIISMRLSR